MKKHGSFFPHPPPPPPPPPPPFNIAPFSRLKNFHGPFPCCSASFFFVDVPFSSISPAERSFRLFSFFSPRHETPTLQLVPPSLKQYKGASVPLPKRALPLTPTSCNHMRAGSLFNGSEQISPSFLHPVLPSHFPPQMNGTSLRFRILPKKGRSFSEKIPYWAPVSFFS